jgi:hypothetical protein
MSRPSIGDIAMTGAERQARYRTAAHRSFASADRPTGRAGSSAGMTPSPGLSSCRRSMPRGWTRCRTISKTVQRPKLCGRLSISISPSSKQSDRSAASAEIEHRDALG